MFEVQCSEQKSTDCTTKVPNFNVILWVVLLKGFSTKLRVQSSGSKECELVNFPGIDGTDILYNLENLLFVL